MEEGVFVDNKEDSRYELHVDGHVAFVRYHLRDNGVVSLTHTVVPGELGGRGVGSRLIALSLEAIERDKCKVLPICSFVVSYIDKHPQWQSLLSDNR